MKNIDKLLPDIQSDCDKISKAFAKQISESFQDEIDRQAKDWYKFEESSGIYKRTYQLYKHAILRKRENAFEYSVSFSEKNIRRKHARKYDKETKKPSKLGSYEDFEGEDMASKVLEWEEEGTGPFSKNGYAKGQGIWGVAITETIKNIDSEPIRLPNDLTLPQDIVKDILNIMRDKFKKQLEKKYKEEFG